jgi:TolB-like protein/tetratricopeptide (TPR) repeat protein
VFRTAALYIVAAWIVIQVAGEAQDAFGLETVVLRYLWIAALAGFPFALVFGWYYDITREGVVHTPSADADTNADLSLTRTDYLIFSALVLVIIIIAYPFFRAVVEPAADRPETRLVSESPTNSIAVMPFVNTSKHDDDEYFSDGLTEELIGSLAKVRGLHVTARTSAFAFKGQDRDIRSIGQQLNVRNILDGSVRRENNRVRIAVQLINVESGFNIWSESFDSELGSVLGVQQSIARSIVDALRIQLAPDTEEYFDKALTVNPDAFDLYLRGRYHWARFSEGGFRQSIDAFQRAIVADPDFAPPHAGLATVYSFMGYFGLMEPGDAYALSFREANTALALDSQSSEALIARGMAWLTYKWDWDHARDDLTRALELSPNFSQAHWALSLYESVVDPSAGLDAALKALSLDPLSLPITNAVAMRYFSLGKLGEAEKTAERMIDLDPDFAPAHWVMGLVHMFNGRYDAAIEELTRSVELSGGVPSTLAALAYANAKSGNTSKALELLEQLKSLGELSQQGHVPALQIAYVYEGLGRTEDALDWLDRAFELRDGWLVHLNGFPRFESLREEERFQGLLRRMNLPKGSEVNRVQAD